jgi:hypothetical protein
LLAFHLVSCRSPEMMTYAVALDGSTSWFGL